MIGVFDSGFGGLTVLKEMLSLMPEYDYVYLGDQARYPYGPRSKEAILKFSEHNVQFLLNKGAKIIIIACNSATTAALSTLQKKHPNQHILGVVIPAAEKAVQSSRYGNIGVVGTTATIKSRVYEKEIQKCTKTLYVQKEKKSLLKPKVISQDCPLLVPLIEEYWHNKPETKSILRKYIRNLKNQHVDTLILGCTHYPILEKDFTKNMGKNCKVINASKEQAFALKRYLEKHQALKNSLSENGVREFYTTDCPEKFNTLGSLFLGSKIDNGEKIELL